jgi:hypothetical protein
MKFLILLCTLGFTAKAYKAKSELKIACRAAMAGMPNGNGTTVYYPNGRELTTSAGKAGATWYYENGRVLTSKMGVPGATFYYKNGRERSTSFGTAGATWYYEDGRIITRSAPALTPLEMAEAACEMIVGE